MRLASRFGYAANQIRRDRPLTHEELIRHVPSIFGEDRHISRSERYAYAYFHERRSLNNFHRDRVITFEQIAE